MSPTFRRHRLSLRCYFNINLLTCMLMEKITNSQLTTNFMGHLTNSAHDEFVNAVYNYLTATDSPAAALPESEPYTQALAAFKATKESEHKAFMLTKKDYASEDLKKANKTVSSLMTALRYALRGFSSVPTDDANKRKAQELYQTIVTAKYKAADSYKEKNAKVSGVLNELSKAKDTLKTFGMDVVATQLETANNTFTNSISDRRAWKTAYRSTQKMKAAREESESALQALFDVIVSRATIEPQIELTTIVNWLKSSIIDARKKQNTKSEDASSTKKTATNKEKSVTKANDKSDKQGTSDTDKNASQQNVSDGKSGSDSKTKSSATTTEESGTKTESSTPTSEGSGTKTKSSANTTEESGTKTN